MTWKTYEVVRRSPDELVVVAHVWYVGMAVAAVFAGIAVYCHVKARSAGAGTSAATLPLLLVGLTFVFLSLNHGSMVLNRATNTFVAERTHWYLATNRVSTTLDDVQGARLNQANTTYQVCVVLRSSDRCVAIYPLDSASGQDTAARAINAFLDEASDAGKRPPQKANDAQAGGLGR